ncbi:uncharacterized protein B0I36DRAFT_375561 [Microdochium trichocladiopsis]|uniref:Uncharacterized protein n=1 Tax=Microdochium trichocladiopsis TaxID=1682393 RepID=A0A9P8Y2B4_9PEZI|nr:uncharacterized protein B0I36DRAFT_375561 [Microdochium trichocladiopsis]KAH7027917.1 hypothetical protein B0I36DRAFT_375561 [Microdochium trichocladiopsis]
MDSKTPRSWLITGASSGLGAALALEALASGARVTGATRNIDRARQAVPEFEVRGGKWLRLDVTGQDCETTVRSAVEENQVDVLVNCAGYALLGALEDISDHEISAQLDANFTGPIRCIRGALPAFRARAVKTDVAAGHDPEVTARPHPSPVIVNFSSGAALIGVPGRSLYCASKFALEGMTEALAKEVEPWGIRVFLVVPGAFKTPFSDTCVVAERGGEAVSNAYRGTPADRIVRMTKNMAAEGLLKGDPDKAAQRVVEAVEGTGMAAGVDELALFRLVLGSDCLRAVRIKMDALQANYSAVEAIAQSTDLK